MIDFYKTVGRLKNLPRTGWVRRGIPLPETVAEHMYRSQFIAYDLAKKLGEDPIACSHMMMIHDLAEALVGDYTPACNISREEKKQLEIKAAGELAELSGNPEFLDVFLEFENGETMRSQICYDADKLECLVQALEYARQYPEKRAVLEDFWVDVKLLTVPGHDMLRDLLQQKDMIPVEFRVTMPQLML
jgi:putative hydrolase of HD superfamily